MGSTLLTIPGKPIAKARPRFARMGKFVKTYSPQETEEGRALWEIKQQWQNKPLEGPISVSFVFGLSIPTSASKKSTTAMVDGLTRHLKKPDTDNFIKFYLDVMNGVVFRDDSQVWNITASKVYAKEPQTLISLEWE
jgi:Holliday junction resolvase RusA-like endonuclease